ncbi:hypothetical protein EXIGLDRAFT_842664 [Exidia glandulosa HHB12029]|uniref:N-acetyltransferase domain-containing protein n=1 Tax=Exidia glandulosa HHB12029 TaxID=1314781 RepID=A0A165D529_EXIGL|nr:hypothetical protein EXIGLDRAFT_842664 [Exidia glandulosa HHB12029]
MPIHVRRLAPEPASTSDVEEAATWLVDAFKDDPVMPASTGGELHLSVNLWRGFIRAGLVGGEVYVAGVDSEDRVDGVAVWFAPGHGNGFLETDEQLAVWQESFAQYLNEDARKFWEEDFEAVCGVIIDNAAGKEGHHSMWHLQLLGTRPSAQRQGVARALIDHIADKAKDAGMRLETFTKVNVAVYEHLGFVHEGGDGTVTSPHGDVPIYGIFRWPEGRGKSSP